MKEFLSENEVDYTYLDVTANLKNLRDFLVIRDAYPVFDQIKLEKRIGLPCLVMNDEKVFVGQVTLDDLDM